MTSPQLIKSLLACGYLTADDLAQLSSGSTEVPAKLLAKLKKASSDPKIAGKLTQVQKSQPDSRTQQFLQKRKVQKYKQQQQQHKQQVENQLLTLLQTCQQQAKQRAARTKRARRRLLKKRGGQISFDEYIQALEQLEQEQNLPPDQVAANHNIVQAYLHLHSEEQDLSLSESESDSMEN